MKVAILVGSVRIGRQSHKIAHHVERRLQERGIAVDLIDLAADPLPILEERSGRDPELQARVERLSERLQAADALLLVTPEYHGSFSGVLKNALDYFWEEFNRKPIGVVAVSAGKMGGINASTQLQHVILSLGAFPLPTKLLVPEVQSVFDESLQVKSEPVAKLTTRFLEEFLWFAHAVVQAKRAPQSSWLSVA
ncbi:FMN reductase [Sorangium cellulosum]|uniref:FMN reductase n=1 Tax=Sorangium cellulosum TaxID=56 RepID=A0A4P2PV07_SORCE|nr:NADPH-dependent FMN reductase [Sorangium cellulosum]AUX20341.1 FMN reductase [Sorangium cellulosum]